MYHYALSVQIRKSKRLYENVSIKNDKEFFTYEGTGTLGEYGMLFYIEHVCVLKRKRRNKLKKSIQGNKRNMTKTYKTYHRVRVKTESKRILIVSDLKPDILFLNEVNANTVEESCPEGYKVTRGRLENANKVRLSAIVKHILEPSQLRIY